MRKKNSAKRLEVDKGIRPPSPPEYKPNLTICIMCRHVIDKNFMNNHSKICKGLIHKGVE